MTYIVGIDKKKIMLPKDKEPQENIALEKDKEETVLEEETIIEVETVDVVFDALTDFKLAIKAKEEQEEKERQERISKWNSSVSGHKICEGDFRDVYFYEWSNVEALPKHFRKVSEFQKWADENKVFVSEVLIKEMKTHLSNYCTCHKNKSTIMLRHSLSDLKQIFYNLYGEEKKEEKKNVMATPVYPKYPNYSRNPYNNYDEEYWEEYYNRNCGWY